VGFIVIYKVDPLFKKISNTEKKFLENFGGISIFIIMNIEITEPQLKRVFFNLMDSLFPNIEYSEKQDGNKGYDITSDGEIVCRIYKRGNVNELFIPENTIETIIDFIPQVSKKPRLISKLISSFIVEKTGLEIFSAEFWMLDSDGNLMVRHNYKK